MTTLFDLLRRHAQGQPDAPFITHPRSETTLTYGASLDLALRLQAFLRARGGAPGDRIVLVLVNHWIFHPLLAACAEAGRVLVPVNAELHPQEMAFILEDAAPSLVITEWEMDLGNRFANVPKMTIAALCDGVHVPSSIPASDAPVSPQEDDVVLLVYTSGTTGSGKAVMLTHRNLISMAGLLAGFYRIGPDDRFLCILPLHHMNGIMITGLLPLFAGAHTVLSDLFAATNAKWYWETVAKHRITVLSLVPSIMAMLLRLFPNGTATDRRVVRLAFCGTAPLAEETWADFERRFDVPVYQGYGLTETTTWVTSTPFDPAHRHDSVGIPLGAEVRIDATVANAAGRAEGEILLRGPMVMPGYYRRNALTRESFRDGFLKTGDIGFLDEDGALHVSGRKKEIIIKNGININPTEIDATLRRHPAVLECKTLGLPDPIVGERVCSVYVPAHPDAPADVADLMAWVRSQMSAFYVPDRIEALGHLPKGPTGKVVIKTLRGILGGELAADALKQLTAWKYKRAQPSDPDAILQILAAAYRRGRPVPLLLYWGCGRRDTLSEIDRMAMDRLAEYLGNANLLACAPPALTVMLNDVHSTINEIPTACFERYYDAVAAYASSVGFTALRQSDVWRAVGLDLVDIKTQAMAPEFDEPWRDLPNRFHLVARSERHHNGACSERGARLYAYACLKEGAAFAAHFPGHLFLTYNGPDMDPLLPALPKLYLYSYKKGKTEKPWFLE